MLQQFTTDVFEVIFFKQAKGYLVLNERTISITNNTVVFISPFQKRQWKLEADGLDFTVLIFQEDFLNDFFADKLFTYRLLYFYQLDHPLYISQTSAGLQKACDTLQEIKAELVNSKPDSEHLVRSLLYYLLLKLNREYAQQHLLPLQKPGNNYAYQFKRLLEKHIGQKQRINEYAAALGISRITLNKAVKAQFNVTAAHMLKQRLVYEIKNLLVYANLSVAEIAHQLNFSEPNHLMRLFKAQTGQTTTEFLAGYQNGSSA
nr:AraC family transcriptional regulator [Rufibacter sp. SYSU D00308]